VRLSLPVITSAVLILLTTGSSAQYPFGKNKITYYPKKWKVIETAHYDIYYYEEEIEIAEFVTAMAEDIYKEYSVFFDLEFERRVPVVLYGTHHDFQENNIVPYIVSEGTGGFTEFIKGRVAVPFLGSYAEMKGVFRHEMVHAFMLEKLRVTMSGRRMFNYSHPPLWFTEGLAEFLAHGGPDSEADMFMRDAVTDGKIVPLQDLWKIEGTYLMYKEGESALHYIAVEYGDASIRLILENWWKGDKFDLVLEKTIGVTVDELDDGWMEYLRKKFYPSVLKQRRINEIADGMYRREKWSFENHPVCVRGEDGQDRIFCLGFGLGSVDLLELKPDGRKGWKRSTVIEGGRNNTFESIPLLRSRVSSKGDTLVFVSKSGAGDVIYLLDVTKKRVLRKIRYAETKMINSPALSSDGRRVAFSGIDNSGRTDIFIYDLDSCEFRRLTEDYYEDNHPDWHPGGDRIVFTSDRCGGEPGRSTSLFTIDPASMQMIQLTSGSWKDTDPRYLPSGDLLFSSDRAGTYDIYIMWKNGRISKQTNVLGGAFAPSPCSDGESFVTAVYSGGTYHAYRVRIDSDAPGIPQEHEVCRGYDWEPDLPDSGLAYEQKQYRPKFGLDLIAATFAVDPDFGYMGNGAQLFFTDMLGDHQISLLFGTSSNDFSDFMDNINIAVTYYNRTRRLNYGFGVFNLASYIGSVYDVLRFERRYGVIGGMSYPFSRFMRVDFQTIFKKMSRDDDVTALGIFHGETNMVTNFISLTRDNILWGIGGPVTGHRANLSLGRSWDLDGSRYELTTAIFDLRFYVNLGARVVLAQRFVSRNSWGSDIQLFYLGGSWDLRGYDYRAFAGKKMMLYNAEIRFPLLDRLLIDFPVGHIDFPMFRGALFLDAGTVSGFIYDPGWIGSIGVGVEMNLGYMPVMRINFSRRTDFDRIENGTRIDFFIGYNF
jgi:hypothetical protein